MNRAGAPMPAVADWTWACDRAFNILALSSGVTGVIQRPGRAMLGRPLQSLGTFESDLPQTPDLPFENVALGTPTGRYYLSGVATIEDGGISGWYGIATRQPLPVRAVAGPASRAGVEQRLRPPILSLTEATTALAGELAATDGRYAAYADDLRSAAAHLRSLVAPVGPSSARHVDLRLVGARACAMVALRAAGKQIKVTAPVQGDPCLARGDERSVLQIFANLLTNAIKFTPRGREVGLDIAPAQAGQVAATIWDTGPGIADADRSRVFNDYERLGDHIAEGVGLGLGISLRLARAMGGELSIDGSSGQGTRIVLTLPAA